MIRGLVSWRNPASDRRSARPAGTASSAGGRCASGESSAPAGVGDGGASAGRGADATPTLTAGGGERVTSAASATAAVQAADAPATWRACTSGTNPAVTPQTPIAP